MLCRNARIQNRDIDSNPTYPSSLERGASRQDSAESMESQQVPSGTGSILIAICSPTVNSCVTWQIFLIPHRMNLSMRSRNPKLWRMSRLAGSRKCSMSSPAMTWITLKQLLGGWYPPRKTNLREQKAGEVGSVRLRDQPEGCSFLVAGAKNI